MTMNFCTKCGNQLEAGLKFCTRCGAPVQFEVPLPALDAAPPPPLEVAPPETAVAIPESSSAAEWQPMPAPATTQPVPAAPQPAPSSKSGCLPAILIALAVLAVIAILVVGGVVYVGYKVKQKATEALHRAIPSTQTTPNPDGAKPGEQAKTQSDDASGLLGGLGSLLGGDDDGDLVQSVSERDPVDPCAPIPFPAQAAAKVPLQAGTVLTTAWGITPGDVESRIALDSATDNSIAMNESTDAYVDDNGKKEEAQHMKAYVCNGDLASADTYMTMTWDHMPNLIHGTTRLRLSDKSFNEIKTIGKTDLRYVSIMRRSGEAEGKPYHDAGTFTRVEPQDVDYPMIVNDERVTLPVIHLTGPMASVGKDPRPHKDRPAHDEGEIYVIDDPVDPLVLLYREKDPIYHAGRFRIEVVKIDYKVEHPVNTVEKQLKEAKRAVTYGIYFDFNKDTIKPESEKVLKEIVQAMTDNPDWKLTVEGHTDNIGGDAYNLDLSKRRAAAVKQALVTRYHIAADRLSTNGYGSSSPVDTNDTLEGRARNRRVELTRE
jgi:outer membrane protein OmpA-like peptidoglycan-associated protein